MAVLKCKMCGGQLEVLEGNTVVECEYCGSVQTVPIIDDEKKIKLYERANKLRLLCEFDKAFGVYESIVAEYPEEAEAYWGLILCEYGIEYIDDPKTEKKIPTCHRSSFNSVLENENFEYVMENSDSVSVSIYREEAKKIEELRKSLIEVSSNEDPYDIFICYKESDENGERTIDSVIAQDVYDELTKQGYRVFFSRVTLEDKLGVEYEPYIFSALNSAKIMLAFGTKYEYYNAVWVKNEWSRFLHLISTGKKKTLIPCYKDIDAYDIPKEFARLQAQDMGKVGAIQDLLHGIRKILGKENSISNVTSQNSVKPLLVRLERFLEAKEWKSVREYAERILDQDPDNAQACFALWLTNYEIPLDKIADSCSGFLIDDTNKDIFENTYYQQAYKYGDNEYKEKITKYKNDAYLLYGRYLLDNEKYLDSVIRAEAIFQGLPDSYDVSKEIENCKKKKEKYQQEIDDRKTYQRNQAEFQNKTRSYIHSLSNNQKIEDCKHKAQDYNRFVEKLKYGKDIHIHILFACISIVLLALTWKGQSVRKSSIEFIITMLIFFFILVRTIFRAIEIHNLCYISRKILFIGEIVFIFLFYFAGLWKIIPSGLFCHRAIMVGITIIIAIYFFVQIRQYKKQFIIAHMKYEETCLEVKKVEEMILEEYQPIYNDYCDKITMDKSAVQMMVEPIQEIRSKCDVSKVPEFSINCSGDVVFYLVGVACFLMICFFSSIVFRTSDVWFPGIWIMFTILCILDSVYGETYSV